MEKKDYKRMNTRIKTIKGGDQGTRQPRATVEVFPGISSTTHPYPFSLTSGHLYFLFYLFFFFSRYTSCFRIYLYNSVESISIDGCSVNYNHSNEKGFCKLKVFQINCIVRLNYQTFIGLLDVVCCVLFIYFFFVIIKISRVLQ